MTRSTFLLSACITIIQRGTADEAELIPPSVCCFFGRDHLRVVRVGVVRSLAMELGRQFRGVCACAGLRRIGALP